MNHYYHFFVSSLPILRLFEPAPWSSELFLAECERNLSKDDLELLHATELAPLQENKVSKNTMTYHWNNFETQLRNRIVRQIAGPNRETGDYERDSEECYPEVELAVSEAWSQANPLERERILDTYRWSFLSDQESTKPFGAVGVVCMYKIKLQLVEKWNRRKVEAGEENLQKVLTAAGISESEEK